MSKNPLLWKFALILVVIAGAIFFAYPPEQKINLALDLRFGQRGCATPGASLSIRPPALYTSPTWVRIATKR